MPTMVHNLLHVDDILKWIEILKGFLLALLTKVKILCLDSL
jgi:hypothetical protein